MAYTAPTAAGFKERFPAFTTSTDGAVNGALALAARVVDETWVEDDFAEARMLYAAHQLTLDGHGSGAEAQIAGLAGSGVKSVKSGSLAFELAPGAAASSGGLDGTSYGRRFLDVMQRNHGGGGLAISGVPAGLSHLARDWPV